MITQPAYLSPLDALTWKTDGQFLHWHEQQRCRACEIVGWQRILDEGFLQIGRRESQRPASMIPIRFNDDLLLGPGLCWPTPPLAYEDVPIESSMAETCRYDGLSLG